jgi:hypothetical protein
MGPAALQFDLQESAASTAIVHPPGDAWFAVDPLKENPIGAKWKYIPDERPTALFTAMSQTTLALADAYAFPLHSQFWRRRPLFKVILGPGW